MINVHEIFKPRHMSNCVNTHTRASGMYVSELPLFPFALLISQSVAVRIGGETAFNQVLKFNRIMAISCGRKLPSFGCDKVNRKSR